MDVARAVGKHKLDGNPYNQLSARPAADNRVVIGSRGLPEDAKTLRLLEVDEEQARPRVQTNIAEAAEHTVAVVAGEGQRSFVEHRYEARRERRSASLSAKRRESKRSCQWRAPAW